VTQYVETPCPHCRRNLRVRVEYIGQWVCCKYCNREFRPHRDEVSPPAAALPSEAALRAELEATRAERDRLRRLFSGLRQLLAEADGSVEPPLPAEHAEADPHNGVAVPGVHGTTAGESQGRGAISIPGYEILGTLREGAMGRVFRARQMSLDRIVAIKVLDGALASKAEYLMRFEREARVCARLSHPTLITTIDAGTAEGHPYFVMEYVEGTSVEDELANRHVFDEASALRIALEAAEALEYLDTQGMLHRDVKPANLILNREGRVKLADFGLARTTGDAELAAVEEGKAVGTPEYISPEQVRGGVEPDIRSDLYSLGATLYRMVTGRVPYPGETSREVMRKHADRGIPLVPPLELNPALSEGTNALILKMLAWDRDQRHRDPGELIADLRARLAEALAPGQGDSENSLGTNSAR
jgi:serine/threonine-protein kinase